jgi:hypothetical protein
MHKVLRGFCSRAERAKVPVLVAKPVARSEEAARPSGDANITRRI